MASSIEMMVLNEANDFVSCLRLPRTVPDLIRGLVSKYKIGLPGYGWQSGIRANWPWGMIRSHGPGGRWGKSLTETLPSQSLGT